MGIHQYPPSINHVMFMSNRNGPPTLSSPSTLGSDRNPRKNRHLILTELSLEHQSNDAQRSPAGEAAGFRDKTWLSRRRSKRHPVPRLESASSQMALYLSKFAAWRQSVMQLAATYRTTCKVTQSPEGSLEVLCNA